MPLGVRGCAAGRWIAKHVVYILYIAKLQRRGEREREGERREEGHWQEERPGSSTADQAVDQSPT